MKVLITGSTGMVGRNILDHSGLEGVEILTPSRQEVDLLDRPKVNEYIAQQKPDIVIHAAGLVGGIQANIANPTGFLVKNLDINRNVIMACYESGVKRLLNLGSSCMYPKDIDIPLTEDLILSGKLEPTNEGYALAKIVAQKLCSYISNQFGGYQYKTLIPCNLFGKYDTYSEPSSHLIPSIIRKIHSAMETGVTSVGIWGSGEARREFMYAGDLADCIVKCLKSFDTVPSLMNVGIGHDYSVNEYYQIVAKVLGFKGSFHHDLDKPVGMKRKLVSVKRLQEWGWSSHTSLEDGVRFSYEYYLSTL